MTTRTRHRGYWWETKRVVLDANGEPAVKQVVCCCARPAESRRDCRLAAGNKTPCRCFCHSKELQ